MDFYCIVSFPDYFAHLCINTTCTSNPEAFLNYSRLPFFPDFGQHKIFPSFSFEIKHHNVFVAKVVVVVVLLFYVHGKQLRSC